MKSNSNSGGLVAVILAIVGFVVFMGIAISANSNNTNATKTTSDTNTNYQPTINKTPVIAPAPVTPKEEPEIWTCYDATSYDKNSNNDNRCVSNKGITRYVSDCEAVRLDPDYCPPQRGAAYYNGCGCAVY